MKTRNILEWFNARSRQNRRLDQWRAALAHDAEHSLWTTHPNNYREKDIGYLTVAGQRVKAKRVYETGNLKGPNWITLDSAFRVGV